MTSETTYFPVLPLRDIVVFPHMIVPLFVGREKSVRALEDVMKDDKQILLVTQKNASDDDPATDSTSARSSSPTWSSNAISSRAASSSTSAPKK